MMDLARWLGVSHPVLQAPMAGVQAHAMAAAVCNAGGLGALPAAMLSLQMLGEELTALATATSAPFNVNFFCHTPPRPDTEREAHWREALAPAYREAGIDPAAISAGPGRAPFSHEVADVVEPFRPAVVSFHFGLPAPDLLARVKGWGSKVLASATTVDEARWLEAHGADAIIAQGIEAGGHRGHFLSDDLSTQLGSFALWPQVVQAVKLPVIAAGGIANPACVRAAHELGVAGVQIGTAYLLCDEALTSPLHRAALKTDAPTVLTNVFTGRPARGIVNRAVRDWGPVNPLVPAFPLATAAIAPLRAWAEAHGHADFTPLWSGQNRSGCREGNAADLTREFAAAWPV
ncbi:MAG TPA: nitronate monooxygenase [Ideonella sp.]|uniref:NAD(P)H-dependent flavin oxidoreductase n=1 Tax=Ideonella sp. TaxID=1929293 RepID=UPI002E31ABB3|nr:nitronate monooxygenase [Ideonella sp.]HEX5687099.1 nitronate monooxygenase [Ideonella sp.]